MRLRWLVLVVAVSLVVSAGAAQDKAGATDKDKIQGTWKIVSGEKGGKPLPADKLKDIKVVFAGDKLTFSSGGKSSEHAFKLDPAKKPKEIDVEFGGKTGTGIYELDGNTLKIAHGELGDPRPKEFASKEGSDVTFMVMKREKSAK
jgi:uncharacterized protein (TIGR03067 family)